MFNWFSLDIIYYPVSAIMWVWYKAFAFLLGPSNFFAWALSVMFLVFTLRAILYKPFVKQIRTTRQMQELQPQIKALQKKYGKDRQRMALEMQKLQKEHGFNPILGCLPMLAQVPVFIGLFHVLRSFNRTQGGFGQIQLSVEQNRATGNYVFSPTDVAHFLDANLFGAPLGATMIQKTGLDAFTEFSRVAVIGVGVPIMILAGIATYFNSRASIARQSPEAAANPQTALMNKLALYVFPLGVVVGGPFLPLAVILYWFANNIWTFGQQHVVFGKIEKEEEAKKALEVNRTKELGPDPGVKPVPKNLEPIKAFTEAVFTWGSGDKARSLELAQQAWKIRAQIKPDDAKVTRRIDDQLYTAAGGIIPVMAKWLGDRVPKRTDQLAYFQSGARLIRKELTQQSPLDDFCSYFEMRGKEWKLLAELGKNDELVEESDVDLQILEWMSRARYVGSEERNQADCLERTLEGWVLYVRTAVGEANYRLKRYDRAREHARVGLKVIDGWTPEQREKCSVSYNFDGYRAAADWVEARLLLMSSARSESMTKQFYATRINVLEGRRRAADSTRAVELLSKSLRDVRESTGAESVATKQVSLAYRASLQQVANLYSRYLRNFVIDEVTSTAIAEATEAGVDLLERAVDSSIREGSEEVVAGLSAYREMQDSTAPIDELLARRMESKTQPARPVVKQAPSARKSQRKRKN